MVRPILLRRFRDPVLLVLVLLGHVCVFRPVWVFCFLGSPSQTISARLCPECCLLLFCVLLLLCSKFRHRTGRRMASPRPEAGKHSGGSAWKKVTSECVLHRRRTRAPVVLAIRCAVTRASRCVSPAERVHDSTARSGTQAPAPILIPGYYACFHVWFIAAVGRYLKTNICPKRLPFTCCG